VLPITCALTIHGADGIAAACSCPFGTADLAEGGLGAMEDNGQAPSGCGGYLTKYTRQGLKVQ
jgi:hypothetical protein